ncbi:Lrp/AsnC family transcriptional regulator [Bacillus gobiensis]|uniref:Lrp/AsnC family transcriptional regulator n=1 Tax=Bacillus gobiensis TaxID=1441095 RepID=UPI003D20A83F
MKSELDLRILNELEKDARLSMRELAKRVSLSAPAVTERVRKLEDAGIIEGYAVQVNYKKLGLVIDCLLEVRVNNGEYEEFIDFIHQHPSAFVGYRVAGRACFFIKISVSRLEEIEEFIQDISGFTRTVSHIVLSNLNFSQPIYERMKQREQPLISIIK